ncbi:MAG: GNAT family N-acetyltransferase [Vulcanimicrobiota bacterium]
MQDSYQISFESSVSGLAAGPWDACAGENPFVGHAFLSCLEESGCVGDSTGWQPYPLVVQDRQSGALVGACPCYLKLHSQGEYMFDYHWADAYHRLFSPTDSYYPKLQVAVPFTPVPGPRLLVERSLSPARQTEIRTLMLKALSQETDRLGYSSAHLTFCSAEESALAAATDSYLPRLGEQYHWFNEGYEQWNDFLQSLTSRKRKTLAKERKRANSYPLEIVTVHGSEATQQQLLSFFRMYQATSMQKWGRPYLNLLFFQTLARKLKDQLVLFLVRQKPSGRWVAGAWNLRSDSALFGRNWGCLEQYDLLHFEVCYYRAIDYAIEHGLSRVEAGAQGTHKIGRGYRPRPVHSVHYLRSRPFRQAIARYLESETEEIEYRIQALSQLEPFKNR